MLDLTPSFICSQQLPHSISEKLTLNPFRYLLLENRVMPATRPVTSLGQQEGWRVFWEGPKFLNYVQQFWTMSNSFELCQTVWTTSNSLNYVQQFELRPTVWTTSNSLNYVQQFELRPTVWTTSNSLNYVQQFELRPTVWTTSNSLNYVQQFELYPTVLNHFKQIFPGWGENKFRECFASPGYGPGSHSTDKSPVKSQAICLRPVAMR